MCNNIHLETVTLEASKWWISYSLISLHVCRRSQIISERSSYVHEQMISFTFALIMFCCWISLVSIGFGVPERDIREPSPRNAPIYFERPLQRSTGFRAPAGWSASIWVCYEGMENPMHQFVCSHHPSCMPDPCAWGAFKPSEISLHSFHSSIKIVYLHADYISLPSVSTSTFLHMD